MTKEFIIRKAISNEAAMESLWSEVASYLLGVDNPEWKWLIPPEVLFGKGGWRAYARIEWTKT